MLYTVKNNSRIYYLCVICTSFAHKQFESQVQIQIKMYIFSIWAFDCTKNIKRKMSHQYFLADVFL